MIRPLFYMPILIRPGQHRTLHSGIFRTFSHTELFTSVNPHDQTRIVVASLFLGAAFLTLAVRSYAHPKGSFAMAGALLAVVIAISAVTQASPLLEGAVV